MLIIRQKKCGLAVEHTGDS